MVVMNVIFLLVILGILVYGCYGLYRINLVYNYRIKVLSERIERYDLLPDFSKMVWQIRRSNWDDYLDGTIKK